MQENGLPVCPLCKQFLTEERAKDMDERLKRAVNLLALKVRAEKVRDEENDHEKGKPS